MSGRISNHVHIYWTSSRLHPIFLVFFLIYSMSPNKHRNKALFQILTIKEYIIYIMAINWQYWLSVIVYCAFLQHLKNPVLPLSDSFCCYKPLYWRHEPANHPLWSDLLVFRLDNISVWITGLNPFLNAENLSDLEHAQRIFRKSLHYLQTSKQSVKKNYLELLVFGLINLFVPHELQFPPCSIFLFDFDRVVIH